MEIVERREHGGVWWGRDPAGAWYRWNAGANGWEGPSTPPWSDESPPQPDEAAIVAAAMAAGARTARALGEGSPEATSGGDAGSMNPVDRWWNRHFPPFSIRRLVFGLAVLPMIAALTELLFVAAGRGFSLPRYLFICISGSALLATAWLPGMRAMAERLQASGAFDMRSPWPWRRKPDAPPPPPLPPLRDTFGREVRAAFPFTVVMTLVMGLTVMGVDDTITPGGFVTIGLASLASSVLIALRRTVWGLALFSIGGGILGGIGIVFLSMMTFGDPGLGTFLTGWVFGSLLLFLHAYPLWRGLRDLEARGFRLPMWLVMGGSVLLVSGAALVFLAER
jgi:hypothetical protein